MQGRAILADEVGLGKTIEAGLVASELRLRGLAARMLVLAPAGLVEQWREELERKFGLPSVVAAAGTWAEPAGDGPHPVVVASLAAARREPLRSVLTGDVVGPADRRRGAPAARTRAAPRRRSPARCAPATLLLLTATPVENRLADLFQLVSLVRPGSLGSAAEFRGRHAASGDGRAAQRGGAAARHA